MKNYDVLGPKWRYMDQNIIIGRLFYRTNKLWPAHLQSYNNIWTEFRDWYGIHMSRTWISAVVRA